VDSILDYGQFAKFQSAVGHIMVSTTTLQSTMDFSTKHIDAGVVDSPPNGGKKILPVSSPSPLKLQTRPISPRLHSNDLIQRKLYVDVGLSAPIHKV
jgi:hypothetical protein